MNKGKSTKRNINVEFLRVVCIILVVLTHTLNDHYVDSRNVMRDGVCLLNTICIVAVPCFFMITGYFSSVSQDPLKRIWKTVCHIALPTLAVAYMSQVLHLMVNTGHSLVACILEMDYADFYKKIVIWNIHKIPVCGAFWYSSAYVKLMLLFPVFRLLCRDTDEARYARYSVYVICFLKFLLADINEFVSVSGSVYSIYDRSILYFLLGYEARLIDWKRISAKLLLFGVVLGCGAMYALTRLHVEMTGKFSDYFFHFSTVPCILSSVCAFALIVKKIYLGDNERFNNVIFYLGSRAFWVYLIHNLVLHVLSKLSFFSDASLYRLVLLMLTALILSYIGAAMITACLDTLKKHTHRLFRERRYS